MAISEIWTPPDDLEWASDEYVTAAQLNAILGNLKWLYQGPLATLVRETDLEVGVDEDVTCEWSQALVDTEDGFDPDSPGVYVIQRDGTYDVSLAALWDQEPGGSRRARLLRDGDRIRGDSREGVVHAEHSPLWTPSLKVGEAISVEFTHNDDQAHTVERWWQPWRSPILKIRWTGPLDGSEEDGGS